MADKVQLIKEEIERRISQAEEFAERAECANDDSSKLSWDFVATQNKSLLQFINSLPKESGCEVNCTTKSEDLEEEIENYIKDSLAIKFPTTDKEQIKSDIRHIAHHFAQWQKKKDVEEIMKTLIGGEIVKDIHNQLKVISEPLNDTFGKIGDRVKIMFVKEE